MSSSRPYRDAPLPPPTQVFASGASDSPAAVVGYLSDIQSTPLHYAAAPQQPLRHQQDSAAELDFSVDGLASGSGVGPGSAAHYGILKGKVQGLQLEMSKLKRELKEANDKYASASAKLNEQKVQNNSLLHRYNSTVSKLSAAEQCEKQLEEAIMAERRSHQETRDALQKVEKQRDEFEKATASLRATIAAFQTQEESVRQKAAAPDRSQFVPVGEVIDLDQRHQVHHSSVIEHITSSLERLMVAQDDDETTLFVARSAVLSAATELDARLSSAENQLDLLRKNLQLYSHDLEDETSRMALSLMSENKELWSHLTKMQYELDRSNTELTLRSRGGKDFVSKDQFEYLSKQYDAQEEKLKRAQKTLEDQTAVEAQVEERIKELALQLQSEQVRAQSLEERLEESARTVQEKERQISEHVEKIRQMQSHISEVQTTNTHLTTQVTTVTQRLKHTEDTQVHESRASLRQAQSERDEAVETNQRLRSELEDAVQRLGALERELESRTTYFSNYKSSLEEQHAAYAQALQDELLNNRQLYEREIDDLRRELSEHASELHQAEHDLEQERIERQAAKATSRGLEEECDRLKHETQLQAASVSKLEEKLRKTQTESEQYRQSQSSLEAKLREKTSEVQRLTTVVESHETTVREERSVIQQQHSTLEADWKESERLRIQLQDEVKKLRQRVAEETQWKTLKDRLDRDREQLMAENVRMHHQYQEVQQQSVQLQNTINQLRSRVSLTTSQSSQVEELHKRLAELPACRQAAEDAKQESFRLREQLEVARQERNEMAARLEAYMEEGRALSRKDQELEQLFKDASHQVRRLDHQIEEVSIGKPRGGGLDSKKSPVERRSPVRPWRRQM